MISIIIPTLNEETTIGATLAALKTKLTLPHEIIVSDGGSDDTTVKIAKRYTPNVVIHSGARQTIAQGRNAGAKRARGEFLVFLDADCSLEDPNAFFKTALEIFEQNPPLVALTGPIRILPATATRADKFMFPIINRSYRLMNNVLHFGIAMGEFQMISRSAFDAVKGYREDLPAGEDANMFYRLSRIGRTRMDPRLVIFDPGRRVHAIGWPRLLLTWFMNMTSIATVGKAYSNEWKVIR